MGSIAQTITGITQRLHTDCTDSARFLMVIREKNRMMIIASCDNHGTNFNLSCNCVAVHACWNSEFANHQFKMDSSHGHQGFEHHSTCQIMLDSAFVKPQKCFGSQLLVH